jgi:6-phosphogluconolactonase (cycloisomerase 2 family)
MRATATSFVRRLARIIAMAALLVPALPSAAGSGYGVYVSTNPNGPNTVEGFKRNAKTGVLTSVGSFDTGGYGLTAINGAQSHAVACTQTHVFVTNAGSNDFSVFRIMNNSGLELATTVPSLGVRPVSLAINGKTLYVLNQGQPGVAPARCVGFSIDTEEDPVELDVSAVEFEATDVPTDIFFTQNGVRLVVLQNGANAIDTFTVGADGGLIAQRRLTNVNAPFGGAKHPRQPFVAFAALADDASPGVISIRATGTAIPAIVTKITALADVDPCWAATTPNGKKLWTSNFQPASLSLYSVKSNGRLAAVSTYTPTSDSPGALDIAVDPRGKFLYQLRALDPAGGANPTPQIDVLRIGSSSADGGLQLVQSIQLSAGASSGSPTGIAVSEP